MWCSQSGDHLQSNLTRFGYILNMKVGKKPKSFNIIGYLLELIINIWQIWVIFFMENPFYRSNFWEYLPIKEILSLSPPSKDDLRTCFSKTLSGSPQILGMLFCRPLVCELCPSLALCHLLLSCSFNPHGIFQVALELTSIDLYLQKNSYIEKKKVWL